MHIIRSKSCEDSNGFSTFTIGCKVVAVYGGKVKWILESINGSLYVHKVLHYCSIPGRTRQEGSIDPGTVVVCWFLES